MVLTETEARSAKARGSYVKGTAFERAIRDKLHAAGYAVCRGAGSKGSSKADLVAFSPHGHILIIQAKTNGVISEQEWNRLYEISLWSGKASIMSDDKGGITSGPIFRTLVVPIIAYKAERGRLVMDEITGFRVHRKPRENRQPYDWRCGCQPPHDDLSQE